MYPRHIITPSKPVKGQQALAFHEKTSHQVIKAVADNLYISKRTGRCPF